MPLSFQSELIKYILICQYNMFTKGSIARKKHQEAWPYAKTLCVSLQDCGCQVDNSNVPLTKKASHYNLAMIIQLDHKLPN